MIMFAILLKNTFSIFESLLMKHANIKLVVVENNSAHKYNFIETKNF